MINRLLHLFYKKSKQHKHLTKWLLEKHNIAECSFSHMIVLINIHLAYCAYHSLIPIIKNDYQTLIVCTKDGLLNWIIWLSKYKIRFAINRLMKYVKVTLITKEFLENNAIINNTNTLTHVIYWYCTSDIHIISSYKYYVMYKKHSIVSKNILKQCFGGNVVNNNLNFLENYIYEGSQHFYKMNKLQHQFHNLEYSEWENAMLANCTTITAKDQLYAGILSKEPLISDGITTLFVATKTKDTIIRTIRRRSLSSNITKYQTQSINSLFNVGFTCPICYRSSDDGDYITQILYFSICGHSICGNCARVPGFIKPTIQCIMCKQNHTLYNLLALKLHEPKRSHMTKLKKLYNMLDGLINTKTSILIYIDAEIIDILVRKLKIRYYENKRVIFAICGKNSIISQHPDNVYIYICPSTLKTIEALPYFVDDIIMIHPPTSLLRGCKLQSIFYMLNNFERQQQVKKCSPIHVHWLLSNNGLEQQLLNQTIINP